MSFWAIALTRAVCVAFVSSAPCDLACDNKLLYCWAASCCKASSDTMLDMYCFRSTPTVPESVVWTAAHAPSRVMAQARPATARRRVNGVFMFMTVKLLSVLIIVHTGRDC